MPQALPLIGQAALQLVAGVAVSALANALRPQQQAPKQLPTRRGFSFDVQVGEAVPYQAVFGLGRARHARHYLNEYGEGDGYHLQIVERIGIGEHDGLAVFLADNKPLTLSGSNADAKGKSVVEYTIGGTPYLWVKEYRGASGQTADAELIARSNPAGRWTSNSTMTGWAYLIITVRYHPDLFGSGALPEFGSVWRGVKVPDLRDEDYPATPAFTRNAAVLKAAYRRGIFVNGVKVLGMGFPAFANDTDYYVAAANVCDELVEYPETDEEMERYEFGRMISDDEEHIGVLSEFDAAMAGTSFKRGGADAPLPGQQLVSVGTLTDADLLGGQPSRIDLKGSASQKKTAWHGQYVSEAMGWNLAPYEPRVNTALEAVLGGRKAAPLNQPFEYREERAQARAEIALRRQTYAGTRVEAFTPVAFKYEPGDLITRVCEWGAVPMIVEKRDPLPDRTGVTLTLRQWSNLIVPESGEEFITLPAGAGAVGDPAVKTITVPVSVVPYNRIVSGTELPYARATWTLITDKNVDQVMFRYWPSSGTESADGENAFADAALQAAKVFGPLTPDTEYDGYAIPIRKDGRTCVPYPFSFTSGPMVAGQVSDDVLASAGSEIKQKLVAIGADLRNVRDRIERTGSLITEQDQANFDDKQILIQQLRSVYADSEAGWLKAVEVATGPDSAIASNFETIFAAHGGSSAQVLIKFDAVAAPAGVTARYAILLSTDGADFGTTGFYMERTSGGVSRIVLDADEVGITHGAGAVLSALFLPGTTYLNTANITNLTADNIQTKSLDADEVLIDGSTVTELIAANAITNVVASVTTGDTNITGATAGVTTWVDVASVSITPDGGDILLISSASFFSRLVTGYGFVETRLTKSGTEVVKQDHGWYESREQVGVAFISSGSHSPSYRDTSPGTSAVTYVLQVRKSTLAIDASDGKYLTVSPGAGLMGINLKR